MKPVSPPPPVDTSVPVADAPAHKSRRGWWIGAIIVALVIGEIVVERFWFRGPIVVVSPTAEEQPEVSKAQPPAAEQQPKASKEQPPAPRADDKMPESISFDEAVASVEATTTPEERAKRAAQREETIEGIISGDAIGLPLNTGSGFERRPLKATLKAFAAVPEETEQEMLERVATFVVAVKTLVTMPDGRQEALPAGSGFLVGDRRTVATCLHVIAGAKEVSIVTQRGDVIKSEGFIYADPHRDLALIRLESAVVGAQPTRLAGGTIVRPKPAKVGERVFAICAPRGGPKSVFEGAVEMLGTTVELKQFIKPGDYGSDPDCRWILSTASIAPSGGGPLVDEQGIVLGVNSEIATAGATRNVSLAIGADEVRRALQTSRHATRFDQLPKRAAAP